MFTARSFRFFIIPLFVLIGLTSYFLLPTSTFAQADPCDTSIAGQSNTQLQTALAACEAYIANLNAIKKSIDQESASYAQEVASLTAKINIAQANIKAKNIAIANLGKDIVSKQATINFLDNKIERGRATLAEILRKTSQIDTFSLPEAILSNQNLSDFFVDIDTYSATDKALEEVFAQLRGTKYETETQKTALFKQQEAEANAKAAIEAAKKQVAVTQAQKQTLLKESENKSKSYSQTIADRQAKAAQIRAVLFQLRDAGPIPFGTALQYAQAASAKTGVRAAFILGIFATESGKGADGTFGGNVGQCLLTNLPNKGDGKGKNTGMFFSQVMKGSRDVDPFIQITQSLGLDAFNQPVSCPQYGGYGGGMGPAQFIPSTWKGMESTIARAVGKATPNPWDPADAFMASALYLRDLGANSQDFTSERTAACRYNSGKTCYVRGKTGPGLQYGINVMNNAATIQKDIDFLQGS